SIEGGVVERVLSGFTDQFHVAGTYDAGGVITGTVTYAGFGGTDTGQLAAAIANGNNGAILTGLIGEQGAVGVFLRANADSTKDNILDAANTTDGYVGGFVVAPAPPPRANHATFKTYYADADARVDDRTLYATPTASTSFVAFVEGTTTSLPTDGLTFTGTDNFSPITVRLGEASSGVDGFAVMYGATTVGNNGRLRAGLLSGTDLGPALSGTSTATWAGSLHFANTVDDLVRFALPTVTVDFDNGTIKTPAVTVASNGTIAIDGLFRAGSNNNGLPVGVLGGNTIYTVFGVPVNLPLIGLIGTEGAIGVFHGGSNFSFAGGFQASPN
ncbi:MAG: hypothetical protein K8953_04030, partial [Proteobacteria bacterium]|nr:hypothetical protein [Pseudomonadota bacterium]